MRGKCTRTSRTLVYMAFTITPQYHGRFRYTHDLKVKKKYARVDEEQRNWRLYTHIYNASKRRRIRCFVECTFGRLSDERRKYVYDATTTIKVTR